MERRPSIFVGVNYASSSQSTSKACLVWLISDHLDTGSLVIKTEKSAEKDLTIRPFTSLPGILVSTRPSLRLLIRFLKTILLTGVGKTKLSSCDWIYGATDLTVRKKIV